MGLGSPPGRPRSRAGLQSQQEKWKLGREAFQGSSPPQKHTYLSGTAQPLLHHTCHYSSGPWAQGPGSAMSAERGGGGGLRAFWCLGGSDKPRLSQFTRQKASCREQEQCLLPPLLPWEQNKIQVVKPGCLGDVVNLDPEVFGFSPGSATNFLWDSRRIAFPPGAVTAPFGAVA